MSAQLRELAIYGHEYCQLIESLDKAGDDWLEHLSCLLPRIHAAIVSLDPGPTTGAAASPELTAADYDERFELFSRLRNWLGDRDIHCLMLASGKDTAETCDSLADDITDIYFELERALELLEREPQHPDRVVWLIHNGFLWHWGQHLVDAERHLYELKVGSQLLRQVGRKL